MKTRLLLIAKDGIGYCHLLRPQLEDLSAIYWKGDWNEDKIYGTR